MEREILTHHLWTLRKSVIQMLTHRGYVLSEDEINQSLEQFKEEFGDPPLPSSLILLVSHEGNGEQMFVFFLDHDEPILGLKMIKNVCQRLQEESIQKAIIISKDGLTENANKSLKDMRPIYMLEFFKEEEIIRLANTHRTESWPRYEILTKDETNAALARHQVSFASLRNVQSDDHVRYNGLKPGDVVKVYIPSTTSHGAYITYRRIPKDK